MNAWDRVDSVEHLPPQPQVAGGPPCQGCTAPCCWTVKLLEFEANTWHDLEYIHFVSGFPELEVVYGSSGRFRFFYRVPCRFLNNADGQFLCGLHGTPEKPDTCVQFDETDCYYQEGLLGTPEQGRPIVRMDHRRWLAVSELFTTDSRGNITRRPTWQQAWKAIVTNAPNPAESLQRRVVAPPALRVEPIAEAAYAPRTSPCDSCSAPCCKALILDRRPPANLTALQYMRYQLGFPGIEIAVSRTGWRTLARTTCRYLDLDTSRCTIFGRPERPTLCTFYNQYTCNYRQFFSAPAGDVVRVGLDEMHLLLERVEVDKAGELPKDFAAAEVRALLRG